ncbi:MAG: thaumarchaeosortase [Thaumarchaeota archaeon]|nr:thaumarchaeosortase [Nitrososphaerota archaeon]
MRNWNLVLGISIIASPILFTLVVFSDSFTFSWNQGRGGFLFALVFIVAELVGLRIAITRKSLISVIPLAVITILYFVSLEMGLRDYLLASAESYNVQLIHSWTWMWDFFILAAFVMVSLTIFFGRRWIRIAPAGPIFLVGSGIILSLDAFFPYDTLGPLQYVVPYLVQANVWLISVLDLGIATARDNVMFLRGDHGAMALQVFWPSAGVHSVIIYSLVMGAFLLKMNIPRRRKSVYFVVGIVGTIIVNMIRIFSLSWYALKVTTDAQKWEAFHEIAGEIMFLPWLFVFLLIVVLVETRRIKKLESQEKSLSEK